MLLAGDIASIVAAVVLAGLLAGSEYLVPLTGLPVWVVLAKLYGLYDSDHRVLRHLTVDELSMLLAWISTSAATHTLLLTTLERPGIDIGWGLAVWLAMLTFAPVARAGARFLWRRLTTPERAVIVGSGPLETATHRKLELFDDIHVRCVGVLDESRAGSAEQLDRRLDELGDVERVIIASDQLTEQLIADGIQVCRRRGLKLSIVPPTRGLFGTAVQLHHVADLPMINYATAGSARGPELKRLIDMVVAVTGLIVLSPLLLLIGLVVRSTSRGPALFRQIRGGLNGEPFSILKFRTMYADAETRLSEVVDVAALDHPVFKLRRDPRVTRLGRWLRRTSLDELPQLVNVLRGEMSLVGPRPEQLDLVRRYRPEDRVRLSVKPGITGPMQVYGRGELAFEERLAVEREYVENLSPARDLRLLLLTIAAVIRSKGAY